MQSHEDDIERRIKEEIERIKWEKPEIGDVIGSIVLLNHSEERIEKFLESGTTQTVEEYFQRVERYYQECKERIGKLESNDPLTWEIFLQKLGKWAYSFLRKKGVPVEVGRYQIAEDCAHEAGARLANIRFPYDVHYDSWACRVVHNVCLNYIRRHTEKLDVVNVDLTETADWLEAFSVPAGTTRTDNRLDLLDAINELNSEDRKKFILLYYFEGEDFDEISKILNRTKNALYKLHFDALENLRKILGERGDISG